MLALSESAGKSNTYQLQIIVDKLNDIDARLRRVEQDASSMAKHVTFVESVWRKIKHPFLNLVSYTRWLMPYNSSALLLDERADCGELE